jgi:hypothetical protein
VSNACADAPVQPHQPRIDRLRRFPVLSGSGRIAVVVSQQPAQPLLALDPVSSTATREAA